MKFVVYVAKGCDRNRNKLFERFMVLAAVVQLLDAYLYRARTTNSAFYESELS